MEKQKKGRVCNFAILKSGPPPQEIVSEAISPSLLSRQLWLWIGLNYKNNIILFVHYFPNLHQFIFIIRL